jgi:DNA-binding NtrC family response regulator
MATRLLLIEDDPTVGTTLRDRLVAELGERATIEWAQTSQAAVAAADARPPRMVVMDLSIPKDAQDRPRVSEGERVIDHLNRAHPTVRLIVLSGQDRDEAVRLLLARRIDDYLFKNARWDEITVRLRKHFEAVVEPVSDPGTAIVGDSLPVRQLLGWVQRVAPEDTSVHLCGESGTGKELVARRIHELSRRADGPFIPVHCGAIPESLIESELFGHVAGAFSGATGNRKGRFQSAHGGTIFLDEIAEVPLSVQAKLLRVLEARQVEPLGSDKAIAIDIRIVTATHRRLRAEVEAGRFREDLYHRLVVFTVDLPPLRDRKEDIPVISQYILRQLGGKMAKRCSGLEPEAMELLSKQAWKGNVRELRNALEGACIRADGPILKATDFYLGGEMATPSPGALPGLGADDFSLEDHLAALEKQYLSEALRRVGGNGAEAGRLLGLKEHTFRAKARRYGLW